MKRKYSQEEVEQHMLGCIYINRDDLNIFVRRKKGLYAWTMNLGNKWSWIFTGLIAVIIILIYMLGNLYFPKSLGKIVPKSVWAKTTQCRVIETDKFDMEQVDLNIGELFQNVKVQGPFREKNTAVNYTWIDIRVKIIDTAQSNVYDTLEINVIRKDIGRFVYSLNIGTQCYKVTSGMDEIDTFIKQMRELADKNN